MRMTLTRLMAAVFAVVLLTPSDGHAAPIRTVDFTATGLSVSEGTPFAEGVLDITPPTTVTGSFTFDDGDAGSFSDFTIGEDGASNQRRGAFSPYTSFTADVGGVTLTAAPTANSSSIIRVEDGIGSERTDQFSIGSFTDAPLSGGLVLNFIDLRVAGTDETSFSGITVPTVAELSAMAALTGFSTESFEFRIEDAVGGFHRAKYAEVTFSVSPVPLPAALPLFASALAGFGFFGWRRRRHAVA